jgi:hypothetical protein
VFLIDHSFALVDRSLGELDAQVKQGVYKLKARLGDTTVERLVVLNRDKSIDLTEDLPLASAAPLENTSQSHEFHMYPAAAQSAQVSIRAGEGAQIFLCARRWRDTKAGGPDPAPLPLPSLSLHRPGGEMIADLAAPPGVQLDPQEPILGMTVEADPGSYALRWADPRGVVAEQTVHAVRDWQVQVFLIEEAGTPRSEPEAPARQRLSILMGRERFDPADKTLRLVEEARAALADERKVASDFVTETLFAKFDNPMLGLFGAHLMLIGREANRAAKEDEEHDLSDAKRVHAPVAFDQSLFDGVVGNLVYLLGSDHPDATALATQSSNQDLQKLQPIEMPPMLWRSWTLLIEASNKRPELVPIATWRRTIGVFPSRPFFVWSPQHDTGDAVGQWQRELRRNLQGESPQPAADLDPFSVGATMTLGRQGDDVSADARERLSTELLAPRAVIDELAGDGPG